MKQHPALASRRCRERSPELLRGSTAWQAHHAAVWLAQMESAKAYQIFTKLQIISRELSATHLALQTQAIELREEARQLREVYRNGKPDARSH